ncbi:UNVERIFIED_CONTAM: hypothetical protein FKN15_018138 [Acipenser sinensis]
MNIPIITGGKALDLAALSCSSNGYASMYSSMSPFSKTSLDINKLYVSTSVPNKIPDEAETKTDKPDEPSCNKQEVSVREESDNDPIQSDEAETETSPTKSPTTPKNVKCKNSSDFSLFSYNNGVVVTSCRELDNNRSALSAASAFAIATAGANEGTPTKEKYRRMSLASTGYPTDQRNGDKEFVIRRAATNRVLNVLRHWVSKHAQISNLIASEILRSEDVNVRVTAVEKWVAVADICRCLHNYNAVLEITSSLNRSAIFRLKKTWLKVSKQTKALIDKLQKLVSSEGRFKNLREALKK